MKLKVAELKDIGSVLDLHYRYQIDTISDKDKKDGFVTTPFSHDELSKLITEEQGLFIAQQDDQVLAYVMAASWEYWSAWPMFAHMINELPHLKYLGQTLSTQNSYQYGPICIDKSKRGSGLLESIFDFSREKMSKRFPILVTFINKNNPRSINVHINKLGLSPIKEFEYNQNHYVELVYDTSKRLL